MIQTSLDIDPFKNLIKDNEELQYCLSASVIEYWDVEQDYLDFLLYWLGLDLHHPEIFFRQVPSQSQYWSWNILGAVAHGYWDLGEAGASCLELVKVFNKGVLWKYKKENNDIISKGEYSAIKVNWYNIVMMYLLYFGTMIL